MICVCPVASISKLGKSPYMLTYLLKALRYHPNTASPSP